MSPTIKRLHTSLGAVLILGGIAHSAGVTRFYVTHGLPGPDRILLDIWIAEAQIVSGVLFVVAARKARPFPWILGGALLVWTYALPFLPVLVHRAPPIFWVMPILYSAASALAVRAARASEPKELG